MQFGGQVKTNRKFKGWLEGDGREKEKEKESNRDSDNDGDKDRDMGVVGHHTGNVRNAVCIWSRIINSVADRFGIVINHDPSEWAMWCWKTAVLVLERNGWVTIA
jgi:hypothetical protein